jgi:acyl carrier protein
MKKKEVDNFLLKILREFAINEDIETPVELNLKTRLMGSKALFDSMDLVSFIVEVEENLNEKFNLNLELANEKAMSRSSSPFISIESLSSYIIENS